MNEEMEPQSELPENKLEAAEAPAAEPENPAAEAAAETAPQPETETEAGVDAAVEDAVEATAETETHADIEAGIETGVEAAPDESAADESTADATSDDLDTPSALEALEQEGDSSFEASEQSEDAPQASMSEDSADSPAEGPSAPSFTLPRPSDLTALDLVPILEAILFAADRPVSLERMRQVIAPKPEEDPGPDKALFDEALSTIKTRLESQDSGYELREAHGGYHFVTRAPFAEYIRRYQASKPFRLGRAAMETLAIIAYRQPITRAEIDQVRGMDSSHLMRTLIERGLVRMAGKAEVPGRPVLYATTPRFLEVMGLNSLNDLPPLSELKQLEGDVEDPIKRMEQGLDRFMQPDPHAVPIAQQADTEGVFDPGLSEIDALLQSAGKPQEEVFESKVHQEVALANQEALEAFQATMPRRRKRTVTYDELVGGEGTSAAGESENTGADTAESVASQEVTAQSAETAATEQALAPGATGMGVESGVDEHHDESTPGPVGNA